MHKIPFETNTQFVHIVFNLIVCSLTNDLSWLVTASIQKRTHQRIQCGKESTISKIYCDIFSGIAEKKSAAVYSTMNHTRPAYSSYSSTESHFLCAKQFFHHF